jgi:hypothetical protein
MRLAIVLIVKKQAREQNQNKNFLKTKLKKEKIKKDDNSFQS